MVSINKRKSKKQKKKQDLPNYLFKLDTDVKQLLKSLPHSMVIDILNAIGKTHFPNNGIVSFGTTESSSATGSKNKKSVIGDNLVIITYDDNVDNDGITNKIKVAFELQANKFYDPHYTMGFRLYLYSINSVDREKVGNRNVFKVPPAITIYTALDLPKQGVDTLELNFDSFFVGDKQYFGADGDYFKIEYPFVNLLAFDLKDFEGTLFEVFQVLYMYRYRKDLDLMLSEDFQSAMEYIVSKIMKFDGMVLEVLTRIFKDLIHDITEKASKEPKKYEEVLDNMNKMKKDYNEKWIVNAKAEGKAEGIAEGFAEGLELAAQAMGVSIEQLMETIKLKETIKVNQPSN